MYLYACLRKKEEEVKRVKNVDRVFVGSRSYKRTSESRIQVQRKGQTIARSGRQPMTGRQSTCNHILPPLHVPEGHPLLQKDRQERRAAAKKKKDSRDNKRMAEDLCHHFLRGSKWRTEIKRGSESMFFFSLCFAFSPTLCDHTQSQSGNLRGGGTVRLNGSRF